LLQCQEAKAIKLLHLRTKNLRMMMMIFPGTESKLEKKKKKRAII